MKVCFITHYPPEKGGVSEYSKKLLDKLGENKNLDIYVICGSENNAPIFEIKNNYKILRIWNVKSYLYPFKLFKKICLIRPDIIHIQFGPYGLKYGGLIGEPILILLFLLKILRIPVLISLHSILSRNQVQLRASYRINNFIFKKLVMMGFIGFTKIMTLLTDKIMLLTNKLDSTIKEIYLKEYKLSPKKHAEIPHGCDEIKIVKYSQAEAKKILGIENKFMLLCFGHIYPVKGIEYAIKATKYLKNKEDIVLYIAGLAHTEEAKIYLKKIKKLINEYRNKYSVNIVLINQYVPNDEVDLLFTATDIVLLPYLDNVGSSGPLHQAASYGRLIIAFNCGFHLRDAVDGNIVLVKYKDSKQLAEEIEKLYVDRIKLVEYSKNLLNYVKKESWEVCADRTYNFYLTMLKKLK
ncbi:MAG: glycosyltransferase [Candidatus Helarchaeota archaeon]